MQFHPPDGMPELGWLRPVLVGGLGLEEAARQREVQLVGGIHK